jgi:putative transposase
VRRNLGILGNWSCIAFIKLVLSFMSSSIHRKAYGTDLTESQWELLRPLLTLPDGGAPKTTDLREVINAILYRLRTGCQWRLLPHDFPPEGTVRRYFSYFKRTQQFETINKILRKKVRVKEGRHEEPTLAIIDSQTTKATRTSGQRGYDAEKNQWNQASLYG